MFTPDISIYQTNGLCRDFCAAQNYVYAITQVNDCWCSNYAPAESVQVSTDKCNHICPGFPDEKCGADGLFSYIFIGATLPSGTRGAEGGSSSTSTDVSYLHVIFLSRLGSMPFGRLYSSSLHTGNPVCTIQFLPPFRSILSRYHTSPSFACRYDHSYCVMRRMRPQCWPFNSTGALLFAYTVPPFACMRVFHITSTLSLTEQLGPMPEVSRRSKRR